MCLSFSFPMSSSSVLHLVSVFVNFLRYPAMTESITLGKHNEIENSFLILSMFDTNDRWLMNIEQFIFSPGCHSKKEKKYQYIE